jgi:hypothetical protein
MVKISGPLFSTTATGTIGKMITFGKNQAGAWARLVYKKVTTSLPSQLEARKWFKDTLDYFLDMADEEKFLWELVLKNIKEYNISKVKVTSRTARCQLSAKVLSTRSFIWNGSPFPPELLHWLATDEIPDYQELKEDLEFLTGLYFCDTVNPYFFPYLGYVTTPGHPGIGKKTAGLANARGSAIAINEPEFKKLTPYSQRVIVAHELTHALMAQHGWKYLKAVLDSETIAQECGIRTAQGELTPIYKYKGKTLSELVPNPYC